MQTDKLKEYFKEIREFSASTIEEVENFKRKFLSKKNGIITNFFKKFKEFSPEEKRQYGKILNELKNNVEQKVNELLAQIEQKQTKQHHYDLTLPGDSYTIGTEHPVSIIWNEITQIFKKLGFVVAEVQEIDDDWHNFTALNFPPDHPARDMQDTFFIEPGKNAILLHTHTSNAQIRYMEKHKPPLKIIVPGRTYRNEDISARSHIMFHQIEGLYVDKDVSFMDLRETIHFFAKELFGPNTKIRFRPSYFPFTEPSTEVDATCSICGGKGCNVCKYTGWLEILGAGMVDPAVLQNVGIDPNIYSGFAFGFGIERIAMLKYRIKDIRLFFENDINFLQQFYK